MENAILDLRHQPRAHRGRSALGTKPCCAIGLSALFLFLSSTPTPCIVAKVSLGGFQATLKPKH